MRDSIHLYPLAAVPDGLSHCHNHRLSLAASDTAAATWETCAHKAADLPPGRRPDMLHIPHDSLQRGHRVREFVCTYRTLRDDQGQTVRLPTLALSDPRIRKYSKGRIVPSTRSDSILSRVW
jgi:hypothetical protein